MSALLLCSALCSSSETALFSVSQAELRQRSDDVFNSLIKRLLGMNERLLMAILLLNNAVNVAFFALASYWGTKTEHFHPLAITLGALGSLILCAEIIPKVIASERSMLIARLVAPFWISLITVLKPVIGFFEWALRPITAPRGDKDEFPEIAADELKLVVERSLNEGVVSSYVHDRLVDVIDLSQVPVHKVMTHRLDCCSIPKLATHDQAITALRDQPSSHILVLDEKENCVGLLGAQHLIKNARPARRLRKPLVIPGVVTLAQALELMQREKANAGIVVDEYGGTDGLLTLAHLAQVLLGETVDDTQGSVRVEQVDESSWRISGNAPIEPWTTLLNSPSITSEVATIGGFMSHVSGSIPQINDRLLFNNILFVVEETDGKRIKTLLVKKLPAGEARRMTQQGLV